jgi:glycine cleavage system H protein
MSFPSHLFYTSDHEWISVKGSKALVGVTHYAVEQLGDIVHLDLPKPGASFTSGDSFGTIESTKTVSDLYLPIDGKIVRSNSDLQNSLESLQSDPYENNWLVEIELSSEIDKSSLMTAEAYEKFIAEQT